MKKVYLIGALLSFGLLAEAQSFMRFEDKAFNFGAKVGFNATFPVINSLSINGKEAENIDIEYKGRLSGRGLLPGQYRTVLPPA